MNNLSYFIGPLVSLGLLTMVVIALLRRNLRERHALWWVIGALLALILSIFPDLLEGLSSSLGVAVPLNLVFILAIAIIFLVSLQHSKELTRLEEKVRTLTEQVTMLEMKSSTSSAKKPGSSPKQSK